MPTRRRQIISKNMAGGLQSSKGETNLKPNENVESRNMQYLTDGGIRTSYGYGDIGVDLGEDGEGIDGAPFVMENYPNLCFFSLNGKIKYLDLSTQPLSSATAYNVDTALAITKDNPVLMREFRGMLYYCNGVENFGRVAVGELASAITGASTTLALKDANGYKFNDATDKVYVEGDEIDYTDVDGEDLDGATNIASAHAAGAIVTQHNAIESAKQPLTGSIKAKTMAFFRNTMWLAGMPDEPNVLRYGKTIASVADILTGNIHDFSDGENYLIGEGGEITALHATRDRLYVFQPNKTFYIGIEIDSTGQENFSPERMFTPDYGCPNPFCVVEMEDVVVFFTGRRLIRIGYDPSAQELLPDKEFDEPILHILEMADRDQSDARMHYNSATKELYVTIKINGLLRTIRYNNRTKAYSGLDDHDPSGYVQYDRFTFFGDRDTDKLYRFGLSLDADDVDMVHRVKTGRMDDKSRNMKLFLRGKVEGRKRPGSPIVFGTEIEGELFGGYRQITDSILKNKPKAGAVGVDTTGDDVVGSDIPAGDEDMKPFTYSFVIGRRGRDISLFWSTYASGARWQIDSFEVEYEENTREPTKHY